MSQAELVTLPPVEQGRLLASVLRGAWRLEPGSTSVSEQELALVAPVLIRSGTAALAWRRLRNTSLSDSAAGRRILKARRIQAAEAAIRQAQLEEVLSLDSIREADPILLKGLAHGYLYPEPAVRYYTDIDLLIRPEHSEQVMRELAAWKPADPERSIPVDVQTRLKDLPERSFREIYAHSRLLPLSKVSVRVLGYEDTLRLSCIHMLRHLGFHPMWLCDVSALLESLPDDFDWAYCLSGERRRTDWMLAVLRLANQVFGVELERCPVGRIPNAVPAWVMRGMLRWWGAETTFIYPWPLPNSVGKVVQANPGGLFQVFSDRWPDPLQAVGRFSWPINRFSGLAAQVLDFGGRALLWAPRQLGFYQRRPAAD
jgi:hypothetical protein